MNCMSEGRTLYRLYDPDPSKGCFVVPSFDEACRYNQDRWGIFWTVNEFEGTRKKDNCRRVISWAVDLDDGTKPEQRQRIRQSLARPSSVVETRNGYHVYYNAVDGRIDSYTDVVKNIVKGLGGDKKAQDVARILRVPGFNHWKDPKKPVAIKQVYNSASTYTESEILKFFPSEEEKKTEVKNKQELRSALSFQKDGSLWEKVWGLDNQKALERVSGTDAVNFEAITFKQMTGGNLNILVNGKSTSCWIDGEKKIGSSDKGGPTVWNWVNWYQRDHKKTYLMFKKHFGELF